MDLQRLRYFVAVAEERHITRAAARLGMAQPPLSQQIRILETELDVRLFERLPKGVALTPAGEVLLEDARALLDAAERAGRRARRVGAGEEGELVGGLTTSAALHPFVPHLLRAFHTAHPGQRPNQADDASGARFRGMDLVGLAGLPSQRNGGSPSNGGGSDLRAPLRTIRAGRDRRRGRSGRARPRACSSHGDAG